MKVFVKRNQFTYKGENYSNDVLLNIKDTCNCIKNIDYEISTSTDKDYDSNHAKIQIYLLKRHIETDVDYDWNENPITNDYEEIDYIPIHYCPICGKKLEIIIEEIVDKTSEIEPFMKELDELEKKRDSTKKFTTMIKTVEKIKKIMNH